MLNEEQFKWKKDGPRHTHLRIGEGDLDRYEVEATLAVSQTPWKLKLPGETDPSSEHATMKAARSAAEQHRAKH